MNSASGQCLCGAVRFTVDNVDPKFYACHCTMCLRWCGGPFLSVRTSEPKFEEIDQLAVFDSSEWAERGFCRVCGTNISYHVKGTDQYSMNSGTFDDASTFEMVGEVFIDEKPTSYEFAGDRPRMTGAEVIAKFKDSGN